MNDLGLDSLDHVEIIVALENEFGKFISHSFLSIILFFLLF
jgi:acyl carrier protein